MPAELRDFDFSALDDPEFLEDSVREELIAPLVRHLGFRPLGALRVRRSQPLIHPFVHIGSTKYRVNITPDYTLFVDDKPVLVIEAKRPSEELARSKNAEQAYSYAIHPDVRSPHYALCNGRRLVVYSIFQFEPVLDVLVSEIPQRWAEVERVLHPRNLARPELRDLLPDFGLALKRLGVPDELVVFLPDVPLKSLAMLDSDCYTAMSSIFYDGVDYAISIDMAREHAQFILGLLPDDVRKEASVQLSRQPFIAPFQWTVGLRAITRLGKPKAGVHEAFVPLVVEVVQAVTFDVARRNEDPTDDLSAAYELSVRAFLERNR